MTRLLTIAEAADRLAVSPKHLRREFVNKGLLVVVSLGKGGKGDRIEPGEVDRLIRSRGIVRCCISEGKRGGSSSKSRARKYADPLGQPANAKPVKLRAV